MYLMFKSIIASTLIAIAGLSTGEAALAKAQNCWIQEGQPSAPAFRCDVSARTNANGHIVWDISHNENNGANFSVLLWDDNTAELFVNGERLDTTWYTDADGDTRVDVTGDMQFIFWYLSPLTGGVSLCTLYLDNMSELLTAYAEYLERMFLESDELATVDIFTVPTNVSLTLLQEWADVN